MADEHTDSIEIENHEIDILDSGNYPEREILQPLAMQGWFDVPVPTRFIIEPVQNLSTIPSPLAQLPARSLNALEVDLPSQPNTVRQLYRSIKTDHTRLRNIMSSHVAESAEGYAAYYAYVSNDLVNGRGQAGVIDGRAIAMCAHAARNLHVETSINDMYRDTEDQELNGGKFLEFRRLAHPETDTVGYFLINTNLVELSVNQQMINPNTIVGPLPDFSVIQVGKIPIFWWRSSAAVDYVPRRSSPRYGKRKRDVKDPKGHSGLEGPHVKKLKVISDTILRSSKEAAAPAFAKSSTAGADLPGVGAHESPSATAAAAQDGTDGSNVDGVVMSDTNANESSNNSTGADDSNVNHGNVQDVNVSVPRIDDANTDAKDAVNNASLSGASTNATVAKEPISSGSVSSGVTVSEVAASRLSANQPSVADYKSWPQAFREGEARCKEFVPDPLLSSETPHSLPDFTNVSEDEVVYAIASVWRALHERNVQFAFANSNVFQICKRDMMVNMTCVGSRNTLFIPLFIGSDDQIEAEEEHIDEVELPVTSGAFQKAERERQRTSIEIADRLPDLRPKTPPPLQDPDSELRSDEREEWTGPIGHHVLIIAERQRVDGPVRMTFLDSLVGHRSQGMIRRFARNIVRNSAWLGNARPIFVGERWLDIARQSNFNACGIHCILNAWAYMLGIELAHGRETDMKRFGKGFCHVARRIINRAMQGHMDAATIRAFMQYSGFGAEQSLVEWQKAEATADELQRRKNGTRTCVMNERILNKYLDDLREQESRNPDSDFDEEQINTEQQYAASSSIVNQPTTNLYPQSSIRTGQHNPNEKQPRPSVSDPELLGETLRPRTWLQKLAKGMVTHRACKAAAQGYTNRYAEIQGAANMTEDQVLIAIVTLWEGLRREKSLFALSYTPVPGETPIAVGRSSTFMLPLFFPSDQGGHHVLVVATRLPEKIDPTVRCDIYDSAPGKIDLNVIRDRAQSLVISSGWLGIDAQGASLGLKPTFLLCVQKLVPNHGRSNASGLYTVLNAWALMLDIQLGAGRSVFTQEVSTMFVEDALEVVNHALSGCMDSNTIQAFLNHYDYCTLQNANDPTQAVQQVQLVSMNALELSSTLGRQHERDIVASHRASGGELSQKAVEFISEAGNCSPRVAKVALIATGGDPQAAFDIIEKQNRLLSPVSGQSEGFGGSSEDDDDEEGWHDREEEEEEDAESEKSWED